MNVTAATIRTERLNFGRKYPFDAGLVARLVGREAIYTTAEGEKMVGTISGSVNTAGGRYLVVRFIAGGWARLDSIVTLVRQDG